MLSGVRGRQVRGAGGQLQGSDGPDSSVSGLRRCMAPAALVLLLGGCSSFPSSMNPVSWWHNLEGGEIAKERPPPPGATEPYPNLASVPPKPEAPDQATLENITNALVADRTNAQHLADAAPLADPSSPSASPALFGKGTLPPPPPAPPPGTQTTSANLSAAEAPPAAPTTPAAPSPTTPAAKPSGTAEEIAPPPAKAPVGDVQTAPLAPPGAAAQPAAQSAAAPPLPTTPPPPPSLPGVTAAARTPPAASASAPAPMPPVAAVAPPRAAPPPVPPAPAPQPARTVPPPPAAAPPSAPTTVASATPPPAKVPVPASAISLTFIAGSADLPALAAGQLKQLAGRRGNGIIAVTGYGDAASNDPDAQAAALTLGLSRAKAMAAALTADGVPASAVQMDAEAIGRGGTARLVQ